MISRAEPAAPRAPAPWSILAGYNAPFALWTGYALVKPWTTSGSGLWCPTHALLGWCPTCGMTGDYAALLYQGVWPGWRTALILAAFIAILTWSIVRMQRQWR